MEIINLNKNEISKLLSKKNRVNKGSEAYIYKLDSSRVIKIKESIYNNILNNNSLVDNKDYYNFINELSNRQEGVLNTSLPSGIVMYNDNAIASIMKYHKGYEKLNRYELIEDPKDVLNAIKKVITNYKELLDNGIYQMDLFDENIMVSKSDVQIIDLDSKYTYIDYKDSDVNKKIINSMFYYLIEGYLNSMYLMNSKYVFDELKSIESYLDYYKFLDELSTKNYIIPCKRK